VRGRQGVGRYAAGRLGSRVLRIWADTSAASLLAAGILGSVVCSTTGPYIAMALAIYGGQTEPVEPSLGYPWLVFAATLAMGVGGRVMVHRSAESASKRTWSGLVLAAATALALLPVVQIVRLVSLAGA